MKHGHPTNLQSPHHATRAKSRFSTLFLPAAHCNTVNGRRVCLFYASSGVPMLCDDAIVETFCQCGEKDKSTVAHLRSVADQPDMACRNCKRSFLSFRPMLKDVIENDGKYPFERL